jgi:4-carboxymuconolactone decarboxylase
MTSEDGRNRAMRYQEILRRLAIVDEGFVGDQAGLVLGPPDARVLDPKTAALIRVGVLAAIGAPEVCMEWSSSQALALGAAEDEIAGVLLAIAPVIGLGRIVGAAPGVADALGYDIEAALHEDPSSARYSAASAHRTGRIFGLTERDYSPETLERATSVPERAENCGYQRSPAGTANVPRTGHAQLDLLPETTF